MYHDIKKQQAFFDEEQNRYQASLITNPPFHTLKEQDRLFKSLPPVSKSVRIADFGAGNGRLTIPLLKMGYSVFAIDVSARSLRSLQNSAKELSLHNNLHVSRFFPARERFSVIVGADILHHVNMDEALPEMYKALQPGGKAIFSEPGAYNPAWYVYLGIFHNWEVEKGMITCTPQNLTKKFSQSGFRKITITGLGFFPRSLLNFSKQAVIWNDTIGNWPVCKHFAYRYIIEVEKP